MKKRRRRELDLRMRGLMTLALLAGMSLGCGEPEQNAPDDNTQIESATAGVGAIGQGLSTEGVSGVVTAPVKALEHVKQMAVLDLQVKPLIRLSRLGRPVPHS